MKMARILLLVLVAAALGGALAACSSSDNKSTATPTKAAAGSPTATVAPTATTAGQAQTTDVTALEFGFHPAGIDVNKGPVTFKVSNGGAVSHTFTVYTDPTFTAPLLGADTGTISSGKSGEFTVTFVDKGVYPFQCTIHTTQMRGEITVH